MDEDVIFLMIFMIITCILNDNDINKEEFNNMLENGDIFEYGLSELENQLQNISSNQFIIQLIRKNYDMIRDNDDIYNRICKKMDECLKDYGR
jgi:hypothetical protein